MFRWLELLTACAMQVATPGDAVTQDAATPAAPAQDAKTQNEKPQDATTQDLPQEKTFPDDRLEQMVAPIALYPDALLAQVMMAATYPLEVIEASRFMQAHPDLKGSKVEEGLRDKDWDASVKSLCGFPDLLQRMNDNLDWLRDLGDASLSQRDDLMDAVQRMRRKAVDAGNLKTTAEMTVKEADDHVVVIEPAATEVVYVPTYYPTYVYGGWYSPWWWYPAFFVAPPPAGPFFYFSAGVPWHWGLWGRCDWGWHRSRIEVDVSARNRFVQRTFANPRPAILPASNGSMAWQHEPAHRRGVNYRSAAVAQRFHATSTRAPAPRTGSNDFRGRTAAPRSRTPAAVPPNSRAQPERPAPPSRTQPQTKPSDPRSVPPTQRSTPRPAPRDGSQRSPFGGVRSPAQDRAASDRGRGSLRGRFDQRGAPTRKGGHDS